MQANWWARNLRRSSRFYRRQSVLGGHGGWIGATYGTRDLPSANDGPPVAGAVILAWVHRVISNLKSWALGVYHGLRDKHLRSYRDEIVSRLSRRRSRHATFHCLLGIGMRTKPVTYKMLISPEAAGNAFIHAFLDNRLSF